MKPFPSRKQILARCEAIRTQHPNQPFGDHWEAYGVPMGGQWGDPKYLGMTGEMEFMAISNERGILKAAN